MGEAIWCGPSPDARRVREPPSDTLQVIDSIKPQERRGTGNRDPSSFWTLSACREMVLELLWTPFAKTAWRAALKRAASIKRERATMAFT